MERQLKRYREKSKLTQKQLAEIVHVATITIRSIENGNRNPSIKTAKSICLALNEPLDKVFPDIFLLSNDTKSTKITISTS